MGIRTWTDWEEPEREVRGPMIHLDAEGTAIYYPEMF